MAGHRLGERMRFLDESVEAVAGHAGELMVDRFEAPERLDRFLTGLELVTFEFENVPVALAERVAERVPIYPGPAALAASQDRLTEKRLFRELGIATPDFFQVDTLEDLRRAVAASGLPAVLKTRRFGYDGKGQAVLRNEEELAPAFAALGSGSVPLILESFVRFDAEVSILGVRGVSGRLAFYSLTENVHEGGILRLSRCPASERAGAERLQRRAEEMAEAVMSKLGYVGVLAIELFVVGGELVANEMAPRVHNSGHWTMDGSRTSQFEQHLRALKDWPLGATGARGFCGMVNLIGFVPPLAELARIPSAHLHWYGKEPRPGRKVGHINFVERSREDLEGAMKATQGLLRATSRAR